jgi:hypothetical protein
LRYGSVQAIARIDRQKHWRSEWCLQQRVSGRIVPISLRGHETGMKEGTPIVARYHMSGPFAMTAGVAMPVDRQLFERAFDSLAGRGLCGLTAVALRLVLAGVGRAICHSPRSL